MHASTEFQHAVSLQQQGLLEPAQSLCEEILRRQPEHSDALRLLAVIAMQAGNPSQAAALIAQAMAVDPEHSLAAFYRASVLHETGQWSAALTEYNRALELDPSFADAYLRRGNVYCALERWDDALADYNVALGLGLDDAAAYYNRAVLLDRLGQLEAALQSYDRAVEIKADYSEAYYNRGNLLHRLKRWEAALASFDRAIANRPAYAEAYANRAVVLSELKQVEAALASCDQAIALRHEYAEAHSNRGFLLQEIREWDAALASCNRAIALKPDYAEAYFNRSIVHLLQGNFANGWADYEWRLRRQGAAAANDREGRQYLQPRWPGPTSLAGKTILIYSEQGLGDTLQFCRYVRLLADRGASVILEVQASLAGLLSCLQGVAQILTREDPLPDFDYHCALLSLPRAFNTHLATIPAATRYLAADAARVSRWQTRLGEKAKIRIGLMWSGNSANRRDQYRSMPLCELLRFLPATFQYVSLQKDVRESDRQTLRSNPQVLHFGDEQQDFGDAAALCECMDLVVSVDTSVAHLSGALGRPTWILLSATPDWRWLLDRTDSPWYPTATLYRQEPNSGWEAVLERLGADLLRKFTSAPTASPPGNP